MCQAELQVFLFDEWLFSKHVFLRNPPRWIEGPFCEYLVFPFNRHQCETISIVLNHEKAFNGFGCFDATVPLMSPFHHHLCIILVVSYAPCSKNMFLVANVCYFHINFGGDDPLWRAYLSNGLKALSSYDIPSYWLVHDGILVYIYNI